LGHFVELGDGTAASSQHVLMQLQGGTHSLRLGKDNFVAKVPSGTPMTIQSGNSSIEIGNDGAITIQGTKISLIADQDVNIQGLNITTKAKVKAATSATQAEITANASAKVSSGGIVEISGAMVKVN
jgi:hypothetical protein